MLDKARERLYHFRSVVFSFRRSNRLLGIIGKYHRSLPFPCQRKDPCKHPWRKPLGFINHDRRICILHDRILYIPAVEIDPLKPLVQLFKLIRIKPRVKYANSLMARKLHRKIIQ